MFVKSMLSEQLVLFHMLLKFPKKILRKKLPLSDSLIYLITQNESF